MRPVLALAALVLWAAGCGGESAEPPEPPPAASPPVTVAPAEPAPPPEREPPAEAEPPSEPEPPGTAALEGLTLEGGQLSSSEFRGRYLFVNVWSSW